MATANISTTARDRLASTKNVTIIDHPLPRRPEVRALVMASIRSFEVCATGDAFSAALHLRDGEWLVLAQDVTLDTAFAAISECVALVAGISCVYSAANDAAERAAAHTVRAQFAAPAPETVPEPVAVEPIVVRPMISDEQLLRDTRTPAELRRDLLAPTIMRMARLRGLGRFRRVADALAALGADQERRAAEAAAVKAREIRAVPVSEGTARDTLADLLERIVPAHVAVYDAAGELDVSVTLDPVDAREAARAMFGHLAVRGLVLGRLPA